LTRLVQIEFEISNIRFSQMVETLRWVVATSPYNSHASEKKGGADSFYTHTAYYSIPYMNPSILRPS